MPRTAASRAAARVSSWSPPSGIMTVTRLVSREVRALFLRRSATILRVACAAGKERTHAAAHPLRDRKHRRRVLGSPQARDLRLREALILAAERRREADVLDRSCAVQLGESQRLLLLDF